MNAIATTILLLAVSGSAPAPEAVATSRAEPPQTPPVKEAAPPASQPARITDRMRAGAESLAPLVRSELAKSFLAATAKLAEPEARTIYRTQSRDRAYSRRAFEKLAADEQAKLTPREFPPTFYYETAYGSPLVYVRLLDLAAPHLAAGARPKLLDFGYGSIGQLQLLAHCGYEAHGVDVEPAFEALYSEPGDVGPMGGGSVAIHTGQWPAEARLREAVGSGFSLITSKNTLKRGYVHPSPPAGQTVDPAKLVHLGVSDEEFLRHVHDALVPGGIFVIYNVCPPQNPPDKEWIPWADGLSPFSREAFAKAGFEVLAFDEVDQAWVLDGFGALGYLEGKPREDAARELFCWFTIVRRRP